MKSVLDQALPLIDEDSANQSDEDEAMYREGEAYRRLHPELKQKYLGQYVAIYGGKWVDHDSNQVDLYLRVQERYPDELVWIAPVLPEPEEVYVIHSPRLAGDF